MKLKKILAAVAACAVAVSAMAVNAFSLKADNYLKDGTVFIAADKEEDPNWSVDSGVAVTDVYGVTFHVEFNADEVADEAAWIGGGIGANSVSTGWKQIEWGRSGKEITCDLENGTITWLSDAPVFKADDAYAQFWLQTWGGTVTIKSADILGKDGVILSDDSAPADDTATDDTATDDAAPADDTATDDAADEVTTDDADADVVDDADEAEDADAVDEADIEADDAADDTAADDAAADDTTADDTAASDTTTTSAGTGNATVAVIASVMAAAGVAAIASKKRK